MQNRMSPKPFFENLICKREFKILRRSRKKIEKIVDGEGIRVLTKAF